MSLVGEGVLVLRGNMAQREVVIKGATKDVKRASVIEACDRFAIRALDVAVAVAMLTVLAPLFVVIAIAITLESRGGVFYRCRRLGLHGKELQVLKFRKMHADAVGRPLTVQGDERFTRLGKRLARYKLDELPQLWNVLKGEMSLVGPRPEDERFIALHQDNFREILSLRPGITGLSQLAFAQENKLLANDDAYEYYVNRLLPGKIVLDRLYRRNRSVVFNLKILIWTASVVLLRREVSVHRATGVVTIRRRPAERSVVAPSKAAEAAPAETPVTTQLAAR
jgi:lipopolysaccharide/colanic/teichoic acid biosynthesis glycosyltransferase